jgi:hypothetical protein
MAEVGRVGVEVAWLVTGSQVQMSEMILGQDCEWWKTSRLYKESAFGLRDLGRLCPAPKFNISPDI